MLTHMVLDFAELADRKTAVEVGLFRRSVRILLDKVSREKLDEDSDTLRCSFDALKQHLGTREAQVRECFITPEKIISYDYWLLRLKRLADQAADFREHVINPVYHVEHSTRSPIL